MLMKLLHSFLINAIYVFKRIVQFFVHKNDYTIINRSIEYTVDHSKEMFDTESDFWKSMRKHWVEESTEYYEDIDEREVLSDPPSCVTKTLVRVKYWYNNKVYKYLTYDVDYPWPPVKSMGINFHIPLSSAQLLDCDDKPVKDMLPKITRYAGPHNDFYKNDVKVKDMLWYNEETLKNVPKIKLRNALGLVKMVDTNTALLTDLRLP